MAGHTHNHRAVSVVGYAGVIYAAIAVFAVTLFGLAAVDDGTTGYTYPLHHWVLAAGAAALVVGVLLSAVHSMLSEVAAVRSRS